MKKTIALLTVIAVGAAFGFSQGTGTPADPYVITTATDLDNVNNNLSASYALGNDIDLTPIIYDKAVIAYNNQFTGTFDGAGFSINSLTITSSNSDTALIGQTRGAIIENLSILGANVTVEGNNKSNIGILCGYTFNGTTISDCYVSGSIEGGSNLGGLVGYNQLSSVTGCVSEATVVSLGNTQRVGGLIGYNFNNSPVTDCYATGNVSGSGEVGGLIGRNQTDLLSDCYATGNVTGVKYVGGLFGYNQLGSITNCSATGLIIGDEGVGGLVGYNYEGDFSNCYALGNAEGITYVGGFIGYNIKGYIKECFAEGNIISAGKRAQYAGGFAGRNDSGEISYCYAIGDVTGVEYNGGFVGYNNAGIISVCSAQGDVLGSGNYNGGFAGTNNSGSLRNSYSSGNVQGESYTAGFCGLSNSGSIINSHCVSQIDGNGNYIGCFLGVTWSGSLNNNFWNSDVSGSGCGEVNGAMGLTNEQMQEIQTFLDPNWNFSDIWVMSPEGYPVHKWLNIDVPMEGDGTKENPYQVATKAHLEQVNMDTDANYIQVANINLSSTVYTTAIISPDTDNTTNQFEGDIFLGSFDGNGYVISGITIDTQGNPNKFLGLFGYVSRGSITNVILEDVSITADSNIRYIGALAGYVSSSLINGCSATGEINAADNGSFYGGLIGRNASSRVYGNWADVDIAAGAGSMYVGGFVGYNYMLGKIVDCYSGSQVYAGANSESIGGFAGRNWFGAIADCYSTGYVSSAAATLYIGGLCGFNAGSLTGSFSTADISTQGDYVGGLLGYNYLGTVINAFGAGDIIAANNYVGGLTGYNFKSIIENCYASGAVTGNDYIGGLFPALTQPSSTLASFWDREATGQLNSAGGESKTTADMQNVATFTNADWQFPAEWITGANGYPALVYPNIAMAEYIKIFSGGTGEINRPYEIATASDWLELMDTQTVWDKYFILTGNIDLKDLDLLPIGNSETSFTGNFDAKGYKISNPSMQGAVDNQGLFGIVAGADISNFVVENVDIEGFNNVGGLIANASDSLITNCSVSGNIIGGNNNIGGLTGVATNNTLIVNCSSNILLQGDGQSIGGLVGLVDGADITGSYTSGDTFGAGDRLGGLAGTIQNGSVITAGYATGSVIGTGATIDAGGLVGVSLGSQIVNSYAACEVSGYENIGGLIGSSNSSVISNCYSASVITATIAGGLIATDNSSIVTESFWDTDIAQVATSAAGQGLTTLQMQLISIYDNAGWDFDNVWWLPTNGYPQFQTAMKGDGSYTNPYQVENQHHLESINDNLTKKYYVLMTDIDISGKVYDNSVIAVSQDPTNPDFVGTSFSGFFDGNGYKISGLTINTGAENKNFIGLFGRIDGGIVKNLLLENVNITAGRSIYVGGIAGWNNSMTINNCYVNGYITTGDYSDNVGGIAGENRGTIRTCFSGIYIAAGKGTKSIGALVGNNNKVGGGGQVPNITNSYAKGSIIAVEGAYEFPWEPTGTGGLVGRNWYALIADCYADTTIIGANNIGGLVGHNNEGTVEDSFWNAETTAIAVSDGGEGLTTAQMLDNQVFVDAGWDFGSAWMQQIGQTPSLVFESTLSPQGAEPMNAENIDKLMFIANNWLSPVNDSTVDINQNSDEDIVDMKIFSALTN